MFRYIMRSEVAIPVALSVVNDGSRQKAFPVPTIAIIGVMLLLNDETDTD